MDNFLNAGAQASPQIGIVPLTRVATTLDGTGVERVSVIDNQMYMSCLLVVQTGVVTGTPTSFAVTVHLEDSTAVGGTYVDYAEPDADGGSTSVPTLAVIAINTIGTLAVNLKAAREFIRLHMAVTYVDGSTPSVNCSAAIILMGGQVSPA